MRIKQVWADPIMGDISFDMLPGADSEYRMSVIYGVDYQLLVGPRRVEQLVCMRVIDVKVPIRHCEMRTHEMYAGML